MKKYRGLVIIAVAVMFLVSVYNMISTAAEQSAQVKTLLKEAQTLTEQGLVARAVEKYSEIIQIDPAEKYYTVVTDLYYNAGEIDNSIAWGEKAVDAFPNKISGYERLLRGYVDTQRHQKAYETLEIVNGRGLHSKVIEEYRSQIQYQFYLEYVGIDDAKQPTGGCVAVHQKEKWGVMTTQGKTVLKSAYQNVGAFANGVIPVCDLEGMWFFADAEGQYVENISYGIPGKITDVGVYNEELFAVCVDGKYKYYDMQFNHCFGEYDYAGAFNNGVAAVKNGNAWYLINTKGENVTKESFDEIMLDARGICCLKDTIVVNNNGKYYLVNKTGKTIGKNSFDAAKTALNGELIAVKVGSKWGYADLNGKIVIEPQYADALSFSNGLGAVCIDNAWGFIDEDNNLVIAAEYLSCSNMQSDGTAIVNTDRGWNILKLYSKNY